jgi:two-component system response regulator HydG
MRRKTKYQDSAFLKADYDACIKALIQSDFNRDKAAKLLNIDRRTLYNKFQRFKEAGLHNSEQVS